METYMPDRMMLSCRLLGLLLLAVPCWAQTREPRDQVRWLGPQILRLPDGGRQVQLRGSRGTPALTVDVPMRVVTAAFEVDGGLLVGGVAPSGESRILTVRRDERGLVLGGQGIALPCHPVALDLRHGLMGIWLADGRVLAAECEGLEALPEFREFDSVGTQPANLPDPFLAILADRRISLSFHSGQYRQFRANGNGQWERQAPTGRLELGRIEVERPSRIGAPLEVRGAATNYLVLEEQGSGWSLPVVLEPTPRGTLALPVEVTSALRPDGKYRLRSHNQEGAWFHPALIRGTAWAIAGAQVEELTVAEAFVTQDRGAPTFHTTVLLPAGFPSSKLVTVCLVATSGAPEPPVVEANGHTWLQPTKVCQREQGCRPGERRYALATSVPIERAAGIVGSWMHVQFALLDSEQRLLGGTGVRSVRVLPDTGRFSQAQETRMRVAAERVWAAHGVSGVQQFWEALRGGR